MGEKLKDGGVSSNSIAESSNLCDQETAITIKGVESSNLCDQETAITIKGVENSEKRGDLSDGVGVKDENVCCVIDVKTENGSCCLEGENQRVCRICHLSKGEIGKDFTDLIELGCGCKGELGFAHSCCAESWFKLRGNRICEICSKTASNITGIYDYSFMEEWNEGRVIRTGPFSSERRRGCLFGQPFCNFLMACIVIAFVMPWFFHGNLF